jgi:hypothetical protein
MDTKIVAMTSISATHFKDVVFGSSGDAHKCVHNDDGTKQSHTRQLNPVAIGRRECVGHSLNHSSALAL